MVSGKQRKHCAVKHKRISPSNRDDRTGHNPTYICACAAIFSHCIRAQANAKAQAIPVFFCNKLRQFVNKSVNKFLVIKVECTL